MKNRCEDFALFGGQSAFTTPLHIAQVNLPNWEDVERMFRGIFARRYYANHGPLVAELEQTFAQASGMKHAVCVTNGTVGLMILAKALHLSGEVLVPAYTFPATIQALSWAGLEPVLCDVSLSTHTLSPATVEQRIGLRTSGILGVHLWGRAGDAELLEQLAGNRGLTLFYDACHGVGCRHAGRHLGSFGVGAVFSFHATKILNGAEGGCVVTDDDGLADRLRTIRNFHSGQTFTREPMRMNGKMSEAQAGMGLLSLADLHANIKANRIRYQAYRRGLSGLSGLRLLDYPEQDANNFQYVVLEIEADCAGLDRDFLCDVLGAENVICRKHFKPGLHRMPQYAGQAGQVSFAATERLCDQVMQLPNSQDMAVEDVEKVCALVRSAVALLGTSDHRMPMERTR